MALGEEVKLTGMTARVMALTDDGRPAVATFGSTYRSNPTHSSGSASSVTVSSRFHFPPWGKRR